MNRIGIIPFSSFGSNEKSAGSSYLRAEALAKFDSNFEIWEHGKKYDAIIFQKVYWKELMTRFEGPKILDLCDPDWIAGSVNIIEIGSLVDAITCSSEKLTRLLMHYFPSKRVEFIPDRLNFDLFPASVAPSNVSTKKVCWFGYVHNAIETLPQMQPVLAKHKLSLRIISDKPFDRPLEGIEVENIFFDQDAYKYIQETDFIINPKSERAFYKFKSNNKTIVGWKLGMAVAETSDEIEKFLDSEERKREVKFRESIIENEYNIALSAKQYISLIKEINDSNRRLQ